MGRIDKAYNDLYGIRPLRLENKNDKGKDYYKYARISLRGDLNKKYLGYGVGAGLFIQGLGSLLSESDVWGGKLKPGAHLQIWWYSSFSEVEEMLNNGENGIGHSVIFMRYGINSDGTLYLIYSDYHGVIGGEKGTGVLQRDEAHRNSGHAAGNVPASVFGTNLLPPK